MTRIGRVAGHPDAEDRLKLSGAVAGEYQAKMADDWPNIHWLRQQMHGR
jgi:hypothetical protein